MRYLVSLLAAAVLLTTAVAAEATTVNRQIATNCRSGVIWAVKIIDQTNRNTGIPCNNWVPDPTRPSFNYDRPITDIEGATRSAKVWWGHCTRDQYAATWGTGANTGYFYTYWHLVCP
jgi:hypothetical protein